jgi:hypothetical protein
MSASNAINTPSAIRLGSQARHCQNNARKKSNESPFIPAPTHKLTKPIQYFQKFEVLFR